jgi:hypothetical protein
LIKLGSPGGKDDGAGFMTNAATAIVNSVGSTRQVSK